MIVDFRLSVFITVARTLSFTKAASMLNVSQPAISKQIKELESEMGEPLFNRQGNRISLTDKASEILPIVHRIMEGYYTLNDTIHNDLNLFEGALNIGASTTIAQYILPTILAKFNTQYPNIKLSIRSANSDEVIEMLQRREIEMAIIEGDNTNSTLHYTELSSDEIVLVSTKQKNCDLTIENIEKIPLIIREDGSGTLSVILSALRAHGLSRKRLNVKMQLGSSEAILRYLKASSDFAFISILVAKEHIKRGELTVVNVDGLRITRMFRFVTLHGQSGRLIDLFKSFCHDHYNF